MSKATKVILLVTALVAVTGCPSLQPILGAWEIGFNGTWTESGALFSDVYFLTFRRDRTVRMTGGTGDVFADYSWDGTRIVVEDTFEDVNGVPRIDMVLVLFLGDLFGLDVLDGSFRGKILDGLPDADFSGVAFGFRL